MATFKFVLEVLIVVAVVAICDDIKCRIARHDLEKAKEEYKKFSEENKEE